MRIHKFKLCGKSLPTVGQIVGYGESIRNVEIVKLIHEFTEPQTVTVRFYLEY